MTQRIFQPAFTSLQRNSPPMLALCFLIAALCRCQCPHVMLFQECFALMPSSPPCRVEEALGEEFFEDLVFTLMLLEPAKRVEAFVNDSR